MINEQLFLLKILVFLICVSCLPSDGEMKLKALESLMGEVEGFSEPKLELEQYETPAHIAAHMVFAAETNYGDLCGKTVGDLGCGCGMLSVGASAVGADTVTG